MTENEAIERLQCMRLFMEIEDKRNESKFLEDEYVANKMAIQALEEIQRQKTKIGMFVTLEERMEISSRFAKLEQYEAIGTIEEFKDLKEKSVAKKPKSNKVIFSSDSYAYCPHCKGSIEAEFMKPRNCRKCGGELDWQ